MNILKKLKNPDDDIKSEIRVLSFFSSFVLMIISGALGGFFSTSLLVYSLLVFSAVSFIANFISIIVAD